METVGYILIDGLISAAYLFLVSVGLTLIFGIQNILNMTHGTLYAIGAYATASGVGLYFAYGGDAFPMGSYIVMLVSAFVVAIIIGPAMEWGILRRFYGRDHVILVLVTYGLFLILEDVKKLIWGASPLFASEPYNLLGVAEFGPFIYPVYDFLLIGAAILAGVLVWYGLNRTMQGKIVLAVIHDREMSRTMGVNVNRVFIICFTIGVFLAALGGVLNAPRISVGLGISVNVIILAFAIVIIGGLGSIEGAAIGALFVGIASAVSIHLVPWAELFIIYLVMAAVLVFRPEGLFQRTQARKI